MYFTWHVSFLSKSRPTLIKKTISGSQSRKWNLIFASSRRVETAICSLKKVKTKCRLSVVTIYEHSSMHHLKDNGFPFSINTYWNVLLWFLSFVFNWEALNCGKKSKTEFIRTMFLSIFLYSIRVLFLYFVIWVIIIETSHILKSEVNSHYFVLFIFFNNWILLLTDPYCQ